MEFHKCTQNDCHIEVDSKCLEGHTTESCPFYNAYNSESLNTDEDDEENEDDEDSIPERVIEPEYIKIYNANALNFEEAQNLIRSTPVNFIVLAGKFKCGKTTIITTIIQLFQQQESFADFKFAGSRTLIGFEQRCHPSRLISQSSEEDTNRTARLDFDNQFAAQTFLHLRLEKSGKYFDFLIADISGEIFDELTTSTELCKKLIFLNRCDHFSLIFDADALSDLPRRGLAKTKTISILRSLIDAGMIMRTTNIQVLFSKWDLLLKKDNPVQHTKFVEDIRKTIVDEFSLDHPDITFIEIASRPIRSAGLLIGHGLDELLAKWAAGSAISPGISIKESPAQKDSREFLKYKFDNNVNDQ